MISDDSRGKDSKLSKPTFSCPGEVQSNVRLHPTSPTRSWVFMALLRVRWGRENLLITELHWSLSNNVYREKPPTAGGTDIILEAKGQLRKVAS